MPYCHIRQVKITPWKCDNVKLNAALYGFVIAAAVTFSITPLTVGLEKGMYAYFPALALWLVIDFRKMNKEVTGTEEKTMKLFRILSVIGVVWYTLTIFLISAMINIGDAEAAGGAGLFAILYAIVYAIVGIVKTGTKKDAKDQLLELNELREKGILTEDEYTEKKRIILDQM